MGGTLEETSSSVPLIAGLAPEQNGKQEVKEMHEPGQL